MADGQFPDPALPQAARAAAILSHRSVSASSHPLRAGRPRPSAPPILVRPVVRALPASARALPEELALLRGRGLADAHLVALARRAGPREGALARLLMEEGLVAPEAYYAALAQSLGLPFLPQGSFRADAQLELLPPPGFSGPLFCGRTPSGERLAVFAPLPETVPAIRALLERTPSLRARLASATPAALDLAARAAVPGLRLASERPEVSARAVLTRGQIAVAGLAFAAFCLGRLLSVEALVIFVSVLVTLLGMLLGALRLAAGLSQTPSPRPTRLLPPGRLPRYSVLVPLYREARVAASLVRHLEALDYPRDRLEILFLLEEDDSETRAALEPHLAPCMRLLTVAGAGPRTKPRALVHGLGHARGELIAVYDGEDRPEPDQLLLAAARFAELPPSVAVLQGHLAIDHRGHRFFPRQFLLEYAGLFDCQLPWFSARGLPFPLGGTSNHFRRAALEAVGGWDPYNVTEDADLAVRLVRAGWSMQVLASTTFEEAPLAWRAWHGQRSRWLKGWLQTLLVTLRDPFRLAGEVRRTRLAVLLVYLLAMVVTLAAHPFFVAILLLYGSGIAGLLPRFDVLGGVVLTLAGASVALCYASMTLLAIAGAAARSRLPSLLDLLLIPAYWLAQSCAFYAAVVDLVRRPHRWQKTEHGLARRPSGLPGVQSGGKTH